MSNHHMVYLLTALILLQPPAAPSAQLGQATQSSTIEVDPAIRILVDRFFETQQQEDVDGYLALWSATANRPRPEQLKYIFESGDDQFSDIAITRASVAGDTARVRVTAVRARVDFTSKRADGTPRRFTTPIQVALALVRERLPAVAGDAKAPAKAEWKIVREGMPSDELAAALIETEDPDERKRILDSEPDLLNVRLVDAISRRADALVQLEQYKGAQAIYERGLEIARIIGNRKSEGQALHNIANTLYFRRYFPGALKLYEQRLAIEREIANDQGIANALLGIATVQYATYEYGAALTTYREALAIQEKLNDELLVANTLISIGNVLYLQGDYDAAIAGYERAEGLKRKYMDLSGAASALEGLGRVYTAQGDYAKALGAFTGVLDERRKRNDIMRGAMVLQSIGEIHFRLGNIDQARASYDDARTDFLKAKAMAYAGRVLQGTALTELVAGRPAEGEKAYADSIDLCTKASDDECIAHAQVGLAFALAAQQKFDEAIVWYGRSIASFTALKMQDATARARIGLAEALSGKGEHAKALVEAEAARHTGVALGSDDLLWRALVSEARAERKLAQPARALGSARAALLAVRRMAAGALDRPGQAVAHDTTTAFATVAILQAESGDAGAAFTTAEAMRAHSLRASLAANERDIARGMTDEERAEERRLAADLNSLIVKRDRQKDLPKPDKAVIAKLDAAIADLTAGRNAWRDELFARLPDLKIWRGLAPAASADDLTRLLDAPDKALLQFIVDEHDTVVIVATGAASDATAGVVQPRVTAHVVSIERQELAQRIARALDGKALASIEAWRKSSAELFSILPQDVVDRLAQSRSIIVIPDDVLWRVPIEALPVQTGYLADRASVTYAASLGSIINVPPAPPSNPEAPIVIVSSPQLPQELLDELKTTAPTWTIRSSEGIEAEIQTIGQAAGGRERGRPTRAAGATRVARAFGAEHGWGCSRPGPAAPASESASACILLSGADATEELITVAPASALHVAAPFRINSASPLFSPVLLTPATGVNVNKDATAPADPASRTHPAPATRHPGDDAELETRELFNMDPIAPIVMFSDPAALSKRDAAANASTVHWAWRTTGTGTTIFRRWGGDEATALEVIGKFYEELRSGKSAAEALHATRAAVRTTDGGRAPVAWAGWLIFGGR